jgi:PHD/YefM family antitoxin component YafN of YafNO toxin-antitoxin module
MNGALVSDVLSMVEFAQDTRGVAARAKTSGRATVLMDEGQAAGVLLSTEAYEKLAGEAYEHRMALELKSAIEGHVGGVPGIPAAEAFAELRLRAEKRRAKQG